MRNKQAQPVEFERRGLWLFLGSLILALLSWTPVLIYSQQRRPMSGDLDLGGAGLAAITIFVSAVFLLCGVTALAHAAVSFLWRKLRANGAR
jgi:polyferredoxin